MRLPHKKDTVGQAVRMSESSIKEYSEKRRRRYGGKRGRSRLLDEFAEMTGRERKHANKVLLGKRRREGRRGASKEPHAGVRGRL